MTGRTPTAHIDPAVDPSVDKAPEQLPLLKVPDVPLQFRLDQRTRARGLAHVAALRAQLASRSVARSAHPADQAA